MKVFIFIVINILSVSAYTIRQISGIDGIVLQQIEFDSNQNTYLKAFSGFSDFVYKLDSNNNINLTLPFYVVWKILVNKQNDVFIFGSDTYDDLILNYQSIRRLKSNSDSLELLFKYHSLRPNYFDISYFIDSDNNIFFNTESGVAILRTAQTTPVAVSGLRDFTFNLHTEDTEGNIYLANNNVADSANSFAIVYKQTKQDLIPSGVHIANDVRYTNGLIKWNNGTVFSGFASDNVSTVVYFEIRLNGLIAQQYINHTVLNGSSDRLFWLAQNGNITHLYYYDPNNNEVVRIEETLNATALYKGGQHAIDSSGNLFLAFYNTEGEAESQVLLLKSNERTFRRVNVSQGYILSMVLDKDDNLWVLTDELYVILKDVEDAMKISESQLRTSEASLLKIKESTGEVFIAADNGLFVCTDD